MSQIDYLESYVYELRKGMSLQRCQLNYSAATNYEIHIASM
jgi:hypothetical protein